MLSSLQQGISRSSETEQFDKTPQFLDALIFLAENLFLIPREERRETLHQQLRALECELLTSNSVYLPIGDRHHRVCQRVSWLLDKVTTSVKVPFAKMKTQVRDHFNQLRDREASE